MDVAAEPFEGSGSNMGSLLLRSLGLLCCCAAVLLCCCCMVVLPLVVFNRVVVCAAVGVLLWLAVQLVPRLF